MLAGTIRRVDMCQPAWSTKRMAWAAGATVAAISAGRPLRRCRWRQVRWSRGAMGRVPRLAQRRVILFFWPMRASSANQISIVSQSIAFARAIVSRRAGAFLKSSIAPVACA